MRRDQQTKPRRRRDWVVEPLEGRRMMATDLISGFVYSDANHDGIFDNGEMPISGSPISLLDVNGLTVASTTTDATGRYQFAVNQPPPSQATSQLRVAGLPNLPTPSTRTVALPQFNPNLGTLTSVDIIDQINVTYRDLAENASDAPATLTATTQGTQSIAGPGIGPALVATTSDTVSFDASAYDGTSDFGGTSGKDFGPRSSTDVQVMTVTDPAALAQFVGNGTVSYIAAADATSSVGGSGTVVQVISTSSGGSVSLVYHYTTPPTARYTIVQTAEPTGFTDGYESRATAVIPGSIGTDVIPVNLGTHDVPNNNFGEIPVATPTVVSSLSGSVYLDSNADGIREPGEFGIARATITLTGVDSKGRVVNRRATTAADGSYSFTNLRPGTYTLTKSNTPAFFDGRDSAGSLGGTVSNNRISAISVPAGVEGVQYNFAELAKPNCRINQLIALNRLDGRTFTPGQIGSLIRTYIPTVVPILTGAARTTSARR